jgi:hypothetical protein
VGDGRGLRYAGTAALIASVAAVVGAPLAWDRWPGGNGWLIGGFVATALVGVVAGAWQAAVHGRPGAGFLAPLVAGMLVRMILVGVGLVVAMRIGEGAAWGFLTGFAIAFVPLQAYEAVWSWRAARARPSPDPASR